MLDRSVDTRINAAKALSHPWFQNTEDKVIDEKLKAKIFDRIRKFHAPLKM
jgi:hypothetical protein